MTILLRGPRVFGDTERPGDVVLASLRDGVEGLRVVLEDHAGRRVQLSFKNVPAYRSIQEELRPDLWGQFDAADHQVLWIVDDSDWLKAISQNGLLDVHYSGAVHYLLLTADECIDILSPDPPVVEAL